MIASFMSVPASLQAQSSTISARKLENLSHFPTGPALDDKFWLYMITWHIGLFVTMLLGQIGYQGRKQGYF
ncbi:unnamed protein product [Bathycoccus prasinos]